MRPSSSLPSGWLRSVAWLVCSLWGWPRFSPSQVRTDAFLGVLTVSDDGQPSRSKRSAGRRPHRARRGSPPLPRRGHSPAPRDRRSHLGPLRASRLVGITSRLGCRARVGCRVHEDSRCRGGYGRTTRGRRGVERPDPRGIREPSTDRPTAPGRMDHPGRLHRHPRSAGSRRPARHHRDPDRMPTGLDAALDRLPAGTVVFNEYWVGGYLRYGHPDLAGHRPADGGVHGRLRPGALGCPRCQARLDRLREAHATTSSSELVRGPGRTNGRPP